MLVKRNLCEATTSLLAKNEMLDSTYIRPIAFKAVGGINLDFREVPTWVAIVAFPYDGYFEKEGLDVCVSSWRRTGEPSVLSLAKASGHYINSVLPRSRLPKTDLTKQYSSTRGGSFQKAAERTSSS